MKKILRILISFILFLILYSYLVIPPICIASEKEEMIEDQQAEFGIQDFLKNSKQYTGEFFRRYGFK